MRYTVIFIFSPNMKKVLMIHKIKGPFPGKINGVGGKIDSTDNSEEDAAMREITEETGLTIEDLESLEFIEKKILLKDNNVELNVFYTRIKKGSIIQQKEEERLEWFPVNKLMDVKSPLLAGYGDIPYYIYYSILLENK